MANWEIENDSTTNYLRAQDQTAQNPIDFYEDGTVESPAVNTEEIEGIYDFICTTESELDDALSSFNEGDSIATYGFNPTTVKTINKELYWTHFGDLNLTSDFVRIGTDDSKPSGGTIEVKGRITGGGSGTYDIFTVVSGVDWKFKAKRATQFGTLFKFDPNAQSSDQFYAGNVVEVIGTNTCARGMHIPTEPSHVFIEGNKIVAHDILKADEPILFDGGSWNYVFANLHSETTAPDIQSTAARNGSIFISGFTQNQPDLKESDVFFSNKIGMPLTGDTQSGAKRWMHLLDSGGNLDEFLIEAGTDGVRFNGLNGAPGTEAGVMQFNANSRYDFLDGSGNPEVQISPTGGIGSVGFENLAGATGDFTGAIRNHDGSNGSGGTTVPKGPAQWDGPNSQWISLIDGTTFT